MLANPEVNRRRLMARWRSTAPPVHSSESKSVRVLEISHSTEGSAHSSLLTRENPKISRLGLEAKYIAGEENYLLHTKLKREKVDGDYSVREVMFSGPPSPNSCIPPLPLSYQMCIHTRYINRPALHKELSHAYSKPLAFGFGSCEGRDLTAAAAVLFPAVTPANNGRASYSVFCTNRSRINQTCALSTMSADKKSPMYADPVCGAPAPFVRRLSEMSSLEVMTMRQEKLQKLRKMRRQET